MYRRFSKAFLKTREDRMALMAFAAAMFLTAVSIAVTAVEKSDIVVDVPENEGTASFPIKLPSDSPGERMVFFTLRLSPFHPRNYYVTVDDCLESMAINGADVTAPDVSFCDFSRGRTFDLGSYLASGENFVKAVIRNDGGEGLFDFKPSTEDPAFLLPFLLFSASVIGYATYHLRRRKAAPWMFGTLWILAAGVLIRIHYLLGTPYWVRGHDTEGHIEYVRHLLDHWAIPKIGEGWESWQPPLYYVAVAIPSGIAGMFGVDRMTQTWVMQLCALAASIASLAIAYNVGKNAIDAKDRPRTLWIFTALFAVFPGLVFFSARINNDVLTALLGFATLALLLRWWKTGDARSWVFLSVCIALSLLTKNTNLLLIPVAGACLLFRAETPWKKKFQLGGISLFALLVISAWLPVYRAATSDAQGLVGNIGNLHSGLLLENKTYSYLTFNPKKIVEVPFNNAWNDDARRQQFPEYLYKSAFFGEFDFGNEKKSIASLILFLSFIPLLTSLFGMAWSARYRLRDSLPYFFMVAFLLAGHAAFRFKYPYSSSQDFRYSILVLLPFAYFLCVGIARTRPPLLARLLSILTGVFLAACAIFLLNLA